MGIFPRGRCSTECSTIQLVRATGKGPGMRAASQNLRLLYLTVPDTTQTPPVPVRPSQRQAGVVCNTEAGNSRRCPDVVRLRRSLAVVVVR